MNVLAIIPARGGSKGIPNKNIKLLNGKPLIYYVYNTAKKSKMITDIILSTDDERIKKVAESISIDVPFLRPKELATDEAPTLGAVQHAIVEQQKRAKKIYDIVVLLQPTSPFTPVSKIDEAIKMVSLNHYNSVISLANPRHVHPWHFYEIRDNKLHKLFSENCDNRHSLPNMYVQVGNIYVSKSKVIIENNKMKDDSNLGYVTIDDELTVNIDDSLDWEMAEFFIKYYQK